MTREEMWAKQKIAKSNVDYKLWELKKNELQSFSSLTHSCIFAVDVVKGCYSFASKNFSDDLGYNSKKVNNISSYGDYLESRIHPDDHDKLIKQQIEHGNFIYSIPIEERNDFQTIYQYRILGKNDKYINVISRQNVLLKDNTDKAWIVMGNMQLSPIHSLLDSFKFSVLNMKSGEFVPTHIDNSYNLTKREKEILSMIAQGKLGKEIAHFLGLSTNTVNNHRKNILNKLGVDNSIEAINQARIFGIL